MNVCIGGISRPASISTGPVYYLHFEHIAQENTHHSFPSHFGNIALPLNFSQYRETRQSSSPRRRERIISRLQRLRSRTHKGLGPKCMNHIYDQLPFRTQPLPSLEPAGPYGFTGFESHRPEPLHPASSASLNPISLAQRSQEPGTSITRQRHLSSDFKCLGFLRLRAYCRSHTIANTRKR